MAEEYVIPLAIDLNGIVSRVAPAVTSLNQVNQAATNATNNMRSGFSAAASAADNAGRRFAGATNQINEQNRSINSLKVQLQAYQAIADKATDPRKLIEYNRKVQELEATITRLSNSGKKGFDEMGNKIDDTSKKTVSLGNVMRTLGIYISAAFLVRQLIDFGKEIVSVTGKVQGVERAFNRINAPGLLDGLRKATRGTVSDLDLMQRAVLANQFDIPIKQLAAFYEFASRRARDLGKDSATFVNDVITGTARGSVKIIDNLGISAAQVRREVAKTGDFAKAVFNIVEKQLASQREEADISSDKFARIGATVTNIQANIGKNSTGIIAGIADFVQFNLDLLNSYVEGLDGKLQKLGARLAATNNTKLVDSFKADSPEEREKALKELDKSIDKQTRKFDFLNNKIKSNSEELNVFQKGIRKVFSDADETLENERNQALVSLSELKATKQLLLGVNDEEAQAKRKADEAYEAGAKERAARAVKVAAERKALYDKLTQLTNDYYSAEIEGIENEETKAVARETVNSQNRIRSLENEKKELIAKVKEFPELAGTYQRVIGQINANIAQETAESAARVAVIVKKGEEDRLELQRKSAKDIAGVLKKDAEAQVDAINEKYGSIIREAKKAGTLTTEVETKLAAQRQKDISNVTIKEQDEALKKQEEIALSAIYTRKKKEGESEKKFERDNQIAVLNIQIEYAEMRRKLISSDPDKIKEFNDLTESINKMRKAVQGLKEDGQGDLFESLGLKEKDVYKYAGAVSALGQQFSDLFGNLANAADERISKIQDQISAIDDLISADQDAVDREQDLADKGRANNLTSAKKKLEDDKKQKAELQKQEEEAQKKKQALQQAALIADTFAQTSNLITSASAIFKALSGIPFVGVPLAIAAISTMFGAFAVAKVTAFNATKQTAAEGAVVGGKSHGEGGNKYVSVDGNDVHHLEIERGERIIRRAASEKHSRLLDAANRDDFSNVPLSDISLQQLLHQTGVHTQIDAARSAGDYNNHLQDQANIYVINSPGGAGSEETLKAIYKHMVKTANKPEKEIYDMGDYLYIKEGNTSYKIYK